MKSNHTPTIKAIFTNFLFVLGAILMVVGFVRGTSTIAKLAFFEKYPLEPYEEGRCEAGFFPELVKAETQTDAQFEETKKQQEAQRERCRQDLEHSRSVKKVEDTVTSISFFVAGLVLALLFKQFIWQKMR